MLLRVSDANILIDIDVGGLLAPRQILACLEQLVLAENQDQPTRGEEVVLRGEMESRLKEMGESSVFYGKEHFRTQFIFRSEELSGGSLPGSGLFRQERDAKIIVFKKKKRKNYRRKQGHRQAVSRIQILEIVRGA